MDKKIHQVVLFKASPQEVYDALMDSKKHAAFTDAKARIGKTVGEKFEAYDGYASGKNLALMNGKKIVQKWRASDWEPGVYSRVTFIFHKTKTGTKMTFTQEGVPGKIYADVSQGWVEFYWDKMKKTFGW